MATDGYHGVRRRNCCGSVLEYQYAHTTSAVRETGMPYDEAVRVAEILERMSGDATRIQSRYAGHTYDVMRFTGTQWVRG